MRNPSSKSNQETLHEQLSRVREQNGLLQRKLQNKTSETDKLQNKIDKIEAELHSYKMLVEQIKHSFGNGEISPGASVNPLELNPSVSLLLQLLTD